MPPQIYGVFAVANEIYRDIIPNCFLSHRLSPLHPNENTHLVSNVLLRRIYNNRAPSPMERLLVFLLQIDLHLFFVFFCESD